MATASPEKPTRAGSSSALDNVVSIVARSRKTAVWEREVIEQTGDLVVVCDGGLRIVHHNASWLQALGLSHDHSILGSALADFVRIRDSDLQILRALSSNQTREAQFEVVLRGEEETRRSYELRADRNRYADGDVFLFLVFREVTGRVARHGQLERELREKDQLLEIMPTHMWITDLKDNLHHVNGRAARLFGIEPGFVEEGYQLEMSVLVGQPELSRGPVKDVVARITDHEGRDHWFLLDKAPYRGDSWKQQGWAWFARDITESRRAEHQLREKDIGLRSLTELLPAIVWSIDLDRQITSAMGAKLHEFGYDAAGLIQSSLIDREADLPDFMRELDYDSAMICGRSVTDEVGWRDRCLQVSLEPIHDKHHRILGCLGLAYDITELREARQQICEANAKLTRASQAKDEFLAAVSHELRTPLNAILGLSEMMLGGMTGDLPPEAVDGARTIHTSGKHLLDLINNILDLSRIQASKMEIEPRVLPFREVLDASLSVVEPLADRRDITIEISLDPGLHFLYADEVRFRQILINLLSNAIKFTPEGRTIGMEMETLPARNLLRITVWDEGIGISAEKLEMLFEPFVQVDSGLNRRYDGSGLGLPLTRGLVELHHGEIQVHSQEGAGTRFEITLPWPEEAQRKAPESPALMRKVPVIPHPQPDELPAAPSWSAETGVVDPRKCLGRILLAEDNLANQTIVRTFLARNYYEVTVAGNGREAVEMAASIKPDIILMDVQMPEMDGLEATRILRQREETRQTPIITLTGMTMTADRDRCLQAGASHYVSKPFDLADLLQLIQGCMSEGLPA